MSIILLYVLSKLYYVLRKFYTGLVLTISANTGHVFTLELLEIYAEPC
jgi:hypothetical protein